MEQVGVVETPPGAWQAPVLTAILYLHMYQGTKLLYRFERQSPQPRWPRRVTLTPDWECILLWKPSCRALLEKEVMYQGTKYSFALPVELTAKFFGLQYRNRTDDIKITFIVAASALYSIIKCVSLLQWLATSIVSLKLVPIIKDIRRRPSRIYPFSALGHVCNYLFSSGVRDWSSFVGTQYSN